MFRKKLPVSTNKLEYEMENLKQFLELKISEKITADVTEKVIAKIEEQNSKIEQQNELYRRIDSKLSDLIKLIAEKKLADD